MENIVRGPPLQPNFWNEINQSLGNYVLDYIRKTEDRVYMIDGETGEELRLYELAEKSCDLAGLLQGLGCKNDTCVGIYAENCSQYMIVQLGIILSGATVATFNHLYTLEELNHLVNLVQPSLLFCTQQTYLNAKKVKNLNPSIQNVIIINASEASNPNTLLLSKLLRRPCRKLIDPSCHPEATVAILFSSGTTGLPKGVMQTHRNILYMLHMIKVEDLFHFEGKYLLCPLPMFHGFGMMVNLFSITLGKTLIFLRKFQENLYLSLIEKYKVQSLIVVPPIVVFLLKTGLSKQYDLSSIKHIFCAAASLKIHIEKEITEKYNLQRIQQGYGMTESTLVVTMKRLQNQKPGTCGSIVPDVLAKVIDTKTNKILGSGEIGELCFRGPGVMKGYVNNPEATSDTIRDGWLHTGDLGYYDNDGDFFIVDRIKELIKYKGYQVAPAELEDLLTKHPLVKDAGVVGIPDERAGELPKAFVVLRPGAKITEKNLQQYVIDKLSPQKWLRGGVTFVNEIPRNSSGKILRKKLKELVSSKTVCKY